MENRDWLFCPRSGTLLELDTVNNVAVCPLCSYSKSLDILQGKSVISKTDMNDFRRRYRLEPLVKTEEHGDDGGGRKRAVVDDEICPKCGHKGLEFYTMQLRSVDEGQTVFYECPKCKHKYSVNT